MTYLQKLGVVSADNEARAFAYDANGNRTSRVDELIVTSLAYDAENRLVCVVRDVVRDVAT
ncbi:MAG TPA: hypothetical protein VF579_07985 [Candidatus Methylomirabilis sp.]